MPSKPLFVVLTAALSVVSCAHTPPIKGNDTGGIIAWAPGLRTLAREIAADHCARYGKVARITSWRARYGEYIGFRCRWDGWSDPRRPVLIRLN